MFEQIEIQLNCIGKSRRYLSKRRCRNSPRFSHCAVELNLVIMILFLKYNWSWQEFNYSSWVLFTDYSQQYAELKSSKKIQSSLKSFFLYKAKMIGKLEEGNVYFRLRGNICTYHLNVPAILTILTSCVRLRHLMSITCTIGFKTCFLTIIENAERKNKSSWCHP